MKKILFKTVFIVLILSYKISLGQYMDCATSNNIPPSIFLSSECNTTNNYTPTTPNHRPIIYVRLNFHFFQRLDGSRNFTETGDGMGGSYNGYQYAQNLVNSLNYHFSINETMKCAPNSPPPAVYPTQVRFVLWANPSIPGDKGVYFHKVPDSVYSSHDYSWANNLGNNFFGSFFNYKNTFSVNGNNVIDIYLENSLDTNNLITVAGQPNKFKTYRGVSPYSSNELKITSTYNQYKYNGFDAWSAAGILAHELGHCFGLKHSDLDQCNDEVTENHTGVWDSCNNVMSYNNSQKAWTPCQLGYAHYYLNNAGYDLVDKSIYCSKNPDSTIIIQSGQHIVWNSSRSLISDVIIEPNASLTIKCKIRMPSSAKIIVKQKGRLIVDDGQITNACDGKMWHGIEVWGTYAQHQTPASNPTYQGRVELKNGAIIENAIEGVTLMKAGDYNTTGGVLITNGAKFINNRKAVAFYSYHNFNPNTLAPSNNLSSFTNTEFIIDNNYFGQYNPTDFRSHVTMWDVEGINFKGCKFEDRRTSVTFNAAEGYQCGIYSLDAGFTVNTHCSSGMLPCPSANIIRSSFKGFSFGIRATSSSGSTKTVSIASSDFDENLTGISISKVNNAYVTGNNIIIGGSKILNHPTNIHFGVNSLNGIGTSIQTNAFSKALTSYSFSNNGVLIEGGGIQDFRTFKNSFTSLNTAQEAKGNNRNTSTGAGLSFICNTHISSTNRDIAITSPPGVALNQGSSTLSAGNVFSNGTGAVHISNGGNPINYYHHGGASEPTSIFGAVSKYLAPANTCPSGGGPIISFPFTAGSLTDITLQNELTTTETALTDLEYNYLQFIDGGKPSDLLNEIQATWPSKAWELRSSLISLSPYLSTKSIMTAAETNILPQAMLLEVCLANPDATKSDEFIAFLQYKIANPLPEYMLDLIRANWELKTPRTILESNIASYRSNKNTIINQLITNEMLKEERNITNIRSLWENRNSIEDIYALVDSYIDENKIQEATTLFNTIPNRTDWNESEVIEYESYMYYLAFRSELVNKEKTIAQLNNNEIEELHAFALQYQGTSASTRAFNVLCFFYQICAEITEQEENKQIQSKPLPSSQDAAEIIKKEYNQIHVFPNPASTYTTFDWTLPLFQNNAVLTISDVTGKIIVQHNITTTAGQWLWDTRNIASGVYFYEIKDQTGQLSSGKVIIQN